MRVGKFGFAGQVVGLHPLEHIVLEKHRQLALLRRGALTAES
jgi:hypothetical protein